MSPIDDCVSGHLPYMSEEEKKKLTQTLDDISRNSMIRKEVMMKRDDGKTVREACAEVGQKVNLEARYVENIYYGKREG